MKRKTFLLILLLATVLLTLSSCVKYKGNYDKGISAFSNGDYATAATEFDMSDPNIGNAPVYAAYSHGMVHWEKAQYAEALPYFEKTQGFMYGSKRYLYCLSFDYMKRQSYQEACEGFQLLGDFEDALLMAEYCNGVYAEQNKDYETALFSYENAGDVMDAPDRLLNLQTQIYNKAIELKNNGDYENAQILFNYLGEYLNSPEYALECRNVTLEDKYEQAESLATEGKKQEAYQLFRALGVYRDSAQKASELAAALGIQEVDESKPYENLE